MTARKAVVQLIEDGELLREGPRTKTRPSAHRRGKREFLFVAPSHDRPQYWIWYPALEKAVASVGGTLQFVLYRNWSDPVIYQSLNEPVDGIFLAVFPNVPSHILRLLVRRKPQIAIFDEDYSHLGIPYVNHLPANGAERIVEHLVRLGHRRIDCFNTQPHGGVSLTQRLASWSKVLAQHQIKGEFIDSAVREGGDPIRAAYRAASWRLSSGHGFAPAVFCLTTQCALGLNRACFEQGLVVGRDISICAMHLDHAQFYTPVLTSLRLPKVVPLAEDIVRYMLSSEKRIREEAPRFQPHRANILLGETAGPPPDA